MEKDIKVAIYDCVHAIGGPLNLFYINTSGIKEDMYFLITAEKSLKIFF